jgi:hypothetical protein
MIEPTSVLPARRRMFHKRRWVPAAPPPPSVLTLVSATYDAASSVVLTFDRPMDIADLDVTTILVNDGDLMDCKYAGWPDPPPALTGPATVLVYLNGVADDGDPGVRLTVGPGNGIVAAGDGGAWPGVDGLPVPFQG